MGSILSFLSPALTAATQAAGAYQGAQAQAGQQKQAQVIQALQLARQAKADALQQALGQANLSHLGAETEKLNHPAPVIKAGPNGQLYDLSDPTNPRPLTGGTKTKVVAPDDSVQFVDPTAPPAGLKERGPLPPQDHFVFPVTADANGKPMIARGNTRTGTLEPTGISAKQTATGGLAGMTDARIKIAASQATNADQIMTQFESKVLGGGAPIPTAGIILAKRALQPDAMGSSAAETILNTQYPDLAQYVRAAKQVATAERLISPRGGSNALTQAEAALSAGGAHANRAQIEQAQQYRHALITGLQGHGGAQSPPPAGTPPQASSNPFADLIPTGHE